MGFLGLMPILMLGSKKILISDLSQRSYIICGYQILVTKYINIRQNYRQTHKSAGPLYLTYSTMREISTSSHCGPTEPLTASNCDDQHVKNRNLFVCFLPGKFLVVASMWAMALLSSMASWQCSLSSGALPDTPIHPPTHTNTHTHALYWNAQAHRHLILGSDQREKASDISLSHYKKSLYLQLSRSMFSLFYQH